jgi:uncharacterized protein (TIGR00369 family)
MEQRAGLSFDPARIAPLLLTTGHAGWLELRYRTHGRDWAELELPWRADLVGQAEEEVLASGPIVSLLDMASGLSIWTRLETFTAAATLDLRIDYQRPARPRAAVIGRVTCYHLTRSAAFVRGLAHDGDPAHPVATMAACFMFLDTSKSSGK